MHEGMTDAFADILERLKWHLKFVEHKKHMIAVDVDIEDVKKAIAEIERLRGIVSRARAKHPLEEYLR